MTSTSINLTTGPTETSGLLWNVTRNEAARDAAARAEILANPGFGNYFTDHMVDICWSAKGGWHRPRVSPYGPIQLEPSAAVFHYAQEIFEGLKAYRHEDGSIRTFRPEANAARMQRSAYRLALPELPVEHFLDSLKQLIAVDGDWVPEAPETSLYLRPFMFAKEAFLGVRPANKVAYYLIASPAGDVLPVRRTRAGDAWDRTQALVLDPHAGSDHGSGQDHGGAPMGPVSIGLPTLRAGA